MYERWGAAPSRAAHRATRSGFFLDRNDERIAVAVDRNDEHKRSAAHRAIFDERLLAATRRIDRHVIRLEARGTRIGRVRFQRHYAYRRELGCIARKTGS